MILVIAYGILMEKEALGKTISVNDYVPVVVKDHKRIFNLRPRMLSFYKDRKPEELAVLNVQASAGDSFNALAFEATDDCLEKLKIREKNHYAKKVKAYDFETGELVGEAVLFIGNKYYHGEEVVSNDFMPINSYLSRCRDAAAGFGERFALEFDSTTFLGDGRSVLEFLENK